MWLGRFAPDSPVVMTRREDAPLPDDLVFENFGEETPGGFALGGGEEGLGGALFDDAAVGQKGDLVGNGTGEVHRVGHEDESAAFGFEVGDDLQDLGGHFRV